MKLSYTLCVFLLMSVLLLNTVHAEEEEEKSETKPKKGKLQIGIRKKIEKHNCPITTRQGDTVDVHYYGKLEDGTEFDSSIKRDEPMRFTFGGGTAIKGWEQGLLGMCVGEKRKLIVPPVLAYGDVGLASLRVPGNATLTYEIELLKNYSYRPPAGEL